MGNPNEREKPIGSTIACAPVTMALLANATLTILKVGRSKFMIGIDEDCCIVPIPLTGGKSAPLGAKPCRAVWSNIVV